MLAGVTIIDPASTYIESGVTIGRDTTIWPNTYLHGTTDIGEDCSVGPNSIVRDSKVGDGCRLYASIAEGVVMDSRVNVGPFSHLREGTRLAEGVHIGNYGEVKNSHLGSNTRMGHFSYVGDATIGTGVNIGAGTITCNFDGKRKNQTEVGNDVFIGSDTLLVAPIKLGEGSRTGAGSVVTKDVPPETLVTGIPARAIKKLKKNCD